MFSKNLKYYRLKKNLTKKELASRCGITPMAISNYENGKRKPDMNTLKKLAEILNVNVSDFLIVRNKALTITYGEYRKLNSLSTQNQEFIKEAIEEYFSRFYSAIEIIGGEPLPSIPLCHSLNLSNDIEDDALALRECLGLAKFGAISDLIAILENIGILVFELDIENNKFSGMNGFVNDRPFIVINSNMSTERNRSTIAHELAHLFFNWNGFKDDKEIEDRATAISGAFLFPKKDVIRELGVHRSAVTNDMFLVCKEYGISSWLLVKRAELCKVITKASAKTFYIKANNWGWKKNEPTRIVAEEPTLFKQLVLRAITENEISAQKGAELLKVSLKDIKENIVEC